MGTFECEDERKVSFAFHGGKLYDAVRFPEGVWGAVVVLFSLGVDMHLHHLGNVLLVDDLHREADGLPGDGSFVQAQEDGDPLGRACWINMKTAGAWADVCFRQRKSPITELKMHSYLFLKLSRLTLWSFLMKLLKWGL